MVFINLGLDNYQTIIKSYHHYPALYIFCCFSIGIFLGWELLFHINFIILLFSAITFFIFVILSQHKKSIGNLILTFNLLAILGMIKIYQDLSFFPPNHVTLCTMDSIFHIEGVISKQTKRRDGKHKYILSLDMLSSGDQKSRTVQGEVLLYQGRKKNTLAKGDTVIINDRLMLFPIARNPGGYNIRRYQQLEGVWFYYYVKDTTKITVRKFKKRERFRADIFQDLRYNIVNRINQNFPEHVADIIKALILGIKQDLDRKMVKNFQVTGTVHVLAISGLHVGFIILILHLIFTILRFPVNSKRIAILVGLLIYIIIVDFKISVVRSALMATLYFLGQFVQRDIKPLNILAGSGIIILIVDPDQLLLPGFQFSFSAVGSILYGYPRLNNCLCKVFPVLQTLNKYVKFIYQSLLISLVTTFGTIPLTWYYFGYVPLIGILLNLIIVPAIGIFVCGSIVFLLMTMIPGMPVAGLSELLSLGIEIMLEVVEKVASFSELLFYLPDLHIAKLFSLYLIFFLICNLDKPKIRYALYLVIFAYTSITMLKAILPLDKKLDVWFLEVGQGDAAIVISPNKEIVVIDAGERNNFVNYAERVIIPFLHFQGIKRIRYLLGTHAHSDHIGGIVPLLREFQVDTLILSRYAMKGNLQNEIVQMICANEVTVRYLGRGDVLNVCPSVHARILHPFGEYVQADTYSGNEVNNSSVVLQLIYGKTGFLFMGDLEANAEPTLYNFKDLLNSQVLKIGHHGSKTSTSFSFLNHVKPDITIISVGEYNRFKHPSVKTINRIKASGAKYLRTDFSGAIHLESNGQKIEHKNWR